MGRFYIHSHGGLMLVVVLVAFLCAQPAVPQNFYFRKVHVYVTNYLESREPLKVHCKSKDDDLGIRYLSYNETYEWSFEPNLFDTTYFWCYLGWKKPLGHWIGGYFDIYRSHRDGVFCGKRCWWRIKEEGLFTWDNFNSVWTNPYNWPKKIKAGDGNLY